MLCYVIQPNRVVLEVKIDQKSKGHEVLEKVCEILGLRTEMDYFGLKYVNSKGLEMWLNLRNCVERQIILGGETCRFELKVKFWTAPHLVLQESTRHQMYNQVISELKDGKLIPESAEGREKLFELVCRSESHDVTWSVEKFRDWAQRLAVRPGYIKDIEVVKRTVAEYWVLKEVSSLDQYGEEIYEVKGFKLGIGPHGIRIYTPAQYMIPYSAIRSTSTLRRLFQLWYVGSDHKEELLEIKCDSNATASALYRALTERHDFYSCDTVRGAVTSQYIRDLKGTIASIFNESTPLGKKYVFDIRKTCREVHDSARRALYSPEDSPQCSVRAEPKEKSEERLAGIVDAFTCRVCMDRQIDTVFFPCAHVVCCIDCSPKLDNCPICRSSVSTYNKLYLPEIGMQNLMKTDDESGQRPENRTT